MKKIMRQNNCNLKLSTCLFNVGLNLVISNDPLYPKSLLANPNKSARHVSNSVDVGKES